MLVNFLICGVQKGGTSALASYCREHGEIGMPEEKELHFFDHDEYFSTEEPDYTVYHNAFPVDATYKVFGEATPIYIYWPEAMERIRRYNPAMKLIVLLRNPIERAWSHWQMEFSRGHETLPFAEAIRREPERLAEASPDRLRVFSYVDRGFYSKQLERLWALFGRDNVLVLRSEELKRNHRGVLGRISDFLHISLFPALENREVNRQTYSAPMPAADRQYLKGIFREEIGRLESALDWDLGEWRT